MQQTVDRYSVAAFLPLAALSLAAGIFTARRLDRSVRLLALTYVSMAAIVAITLGGRLLKLSAWGYRGLHIDWLVDAASWRNLLNFDRGSLLNVVLFVPAGALLTRATGRIRVSVIVLVVLSLLIEMTQRTWLLGAADVRDTFANTIGVVVGSVAAVVAQRIRKPGSATSA